MDFFFGLVKDAMASRREPSFTGLHLITIFTFEATVHVRLRILLVIWEHLWLPLFVKLHDTFFFAFLG